MRLDGWPQAAVILVTVLPAVLGQNAALNVHNGPGFGSA